MSKKYSDDLKKEVVKEYLRGGKKTSEIAKAYNLASSTVLGWVRKYSSENKYVDEGFSVEQAKIIKELKEEMVELKKENEFLKKAAAFFAREKKTH